jgi:hypothetical protein
VQAFDADVMLPIVAKVVAVEQLGPARATAPSGAVVDGERLVVGVGYPESELAGVEVAQDPPDGRGDVGAMPPLSICVRMSTRDGRSSMR